MTRFYRHLMKRMMKSKCGVIGTFSIILDRFDEILFKINQRSIYPASMFSVYCSHHRSQSYSLTFRAVGMIPAL